MMMGHRTLLLRATNFHTRAKSFVTIDVLLNIASSGLNFQMLQKTVGNRYSGFDVDYLATPVCDAWTFFRTAIFPDLRSGGHQK